MTRTRGYTVVEVMIASGLFLLILALFAPVWLIVRRAWDQSGRFQDAQRSDLVVVYRLRYDYLSGKPGTLQVQRGNPTVVSFLSYNAAVDQEPVWDSNGDILWRKWVAYRYSPDQQRVERSELPLPSPVSQAPTTRPAWTDYPPPTQIAVNITEFAIPNPLPGSTLTVNVTAKLNDTLSRNQLSVFPRLYETDASAY